MKKLILISLLLVTSLVMAQEVITTTSWVAAYAEAAGADAYSLAPVDMVHPPEYELKPGDIVKLKNSDLVIFAGYEAMVKELKGPLELKDDNLLQIQTGYDIETITNSVKSIAIKLETEEIADKKIAEIEELYNFYKNKLAEKNLLNKKYLIDFHMQTFAKELGLNIVGIFGPAPVKPNQLAEFKNSGAEIIINNIHAPKAETLKEVLPNAKVVDFINFPGYDGTETLEDVIKYNLEQLNE